MTIIEPPSEGVDTPPRFICTTCLDHYAALDDDPHCAMCHGGDS